MKVDLVEDILSKHTDEEVIEFLYSSMSSICTVLNEAVDNQNLMSIGSTLPAIVQNTAILRGLKRKNDNKNMV